MLRGVIYIDVGILYGVDGIIILKYCWIYIWISLRSNFFLNVMLIMVF